MVARGGSRARWLFAHDLAIPPTSVSSLLSYWDPLNPGTLFQEIAGSTAVTADGQNVGHMAGLVNAVASADDSTRPTYAAAGINGRPAINFASASSQRLTANAIATGTLTGDDKPYSFVAVVQPTTTTATTYIFAMGSTSSTDPLVGLRTIAANNLVHVRRATIAGGAKSRTSPSAGLGLVTDGCPLVVGCRFTGTQGDIWVNGTQVLNYGDLDVASLTSDSFALGSFQTGGTFSLFWNGLIGRAAIYSRAIDVREIIGVQRFFGLSYGVNC